MAHLEMGKNNSVTSLQDEIPVCQWEEEFLQPS